MTTFNNALTVPELCDIKNMANEKLDMYINNLNMATDEVLIDIINDSINYTKVLLSKIENMIHEQLTNS